MPAMAQPLPEPQSALRSKSCRSSSHMCEYSFFTESCNAFRQPAICFIASTGCPATARNGGSM